MAILDLIIIITIFVSVIFFKKCKSTEKDIFESTDFWIYKILSLLGIIVIFAFVVILVRPILFISTGQEKYDFGGIALILVFFLQWVVFPKRVVVNNNEFYYLTRFGGARRICELDTLVTYNFSEKGRLNLSYKYTKENVMDIGIMGKFNTNEILRIRDILNTRGMEIKV